ncbi:hypothetical protein E0K83_06435 [Gramella sp. BOM4]|nr:hypothetical protein [Christiangramia bathymodioli]
MSEKKIFLKQGEFHIGDSPEANEALLLTENPKYVRKGVTGMGGTTSVLKDTYQNWLVISPNVGMIKSKARHKYPNQRVFFIYGRSPDNWKHVLGYIKKSPKGILKINTTPDQVVIVRNSYPKLYDWLKEQPVFVDEAHAYSADADYRKSFGVFMELVYNEWEAAFTLSTATPIYRHLTLPEDIAIDFIGIERQHQPVRELKYSENLNDAFKFINEKVLDGHLVCVFTNNPKIHMKQYKGLITGNVVGENLRIKLQPMGKAQYDILDDSVFTENQVVFLSSANFAGTDIYPDCCIVIINQGRHQATTVNVNNVVQAYGRCRNKVHDALFINIPPAKDFIPPSLDDVEEEIKFYKSSLIHYKRQQTTNRKLKDKNFTPHGYVNRNYLAQSVLEVIDEYQLYNWEVLVKTLNEYKFRLEKYQQLHSDSDSVEFSSLTFGERIKNLLELDSGLLWSDYLTIKRCVRVGQVGSFNYEIALQYLTSFIVKEWNLKILIKDLNDTSVKPHRFYDDLENMFRLHTNINKYCTRSLDSERLLKAKQKWPSIYKYFARDLSGDFSGADLDSIVQDWMLLYHIHKLKHLKRKESIIADGLSEMDELNRVLSILEIPTDFRYYKPHIEDKNHRVRNTISSICNTMQALDYTPTEDEIFDIGEEVKKVYKTIDDALLEIEDTDTKKKFKLPNHNSRSINKTKFINTIGFLYYQNNYTIKETNFREYNPLTALPRKLRPFLPLVYVECDIVAANAQFTDRFLGCSNYQNLYERIATTEGCSRHQAKYRYNMYLNNHRSRRSKSMEFYYNICNYTKENSEKLAINTARVQEGSYYKKMVRYEQDLIENYQDYLECQSFRFHDAIVVPLWEAENLSLSTNFNGYEFRIGYYTNKQLNYEGKTNSTPINHHCVLKEMKLVQ